MRVLICRAGHDGCSVTPEIVRELAEREKNDVVVCEYVSVRGGLEAPTAYVVVSDPKLALRVGTILQSRQFRKLTDPNCNFVKWGMAVFQGSWFAQAIAETFCGASAEVVFYRGEEISARTA